jgi:hypothetical protein
MAAQVFNPAAGRSEGNRHSRCSPEFVCSNLPIVGSDRISCRADDANIKYR